MNIHSYRVALSHAGSRVTLQLARARSRDARRCTGHSVSAAVAGYISSNPVSAMPVEKRWRWPVSSWVIFGTA